MVSESNKYVLKKKNKPHNTVRFKRKGSSAKPVR